MRATGCLVVPVVIGRAPAWTVGPLPSSALWPSSSPQARVADDAARLRYFEPRIAQTLYGTASGAAVRWHRVATTTWDGVTVLAVEVLRAPAGSGANHGLAVLHLRLGGDPVAELAGLRDLSGVNGPRWQSVLPAGTGVAPGARRASTVCHVTFDGPTPAGMSAAYDAWPARDQWLWQLASATTESVFPPDVEDASLLAGRVRFSADWQALVLRDGASFVGTTPDPGGTDTFHAAAQTYVHSIYLDVLLLGRLQADALNALANQIADVPLPRFGAGGLQAVEGRLIELRRAFGRDVITAHDKGNEILDRYVTQHRVPELRARLVEDLTDSARFVEAAAARSTNAALGLVAVLGLPFGLSYAAGALWGANGVRGLLVWTGVAVALSLVLTTLSPVRAMLRDLGNRLERP
ncbi:hypothetical protein E1283_18885 [Streptomyces hainanensis]|uniref:Uncharacterized protein n=1 Tax=Streptomyces hainanensis TaxID=402648 RepID=A0A4R4T914_9ACTN|nr:hypothetical protein E1283_18885 [Streptomyces hainanensis]